MFIWDSVYACQKYQSPTEVKDIEMLSDYRSCSYKTSRIKTLKHKNGNNSYRPENFSEKNFGGDGGGGGGAGGTPLNCGHAGLFPEV